MWFKTLCFYSIGSLLLLIMSTSAVHANGDTSYHVSGDTSYAQILNNIAPNEIHIPFEIIDNRIIITVKHQTLGALRLLIDTGATTSILFKSLDPYSTTLPSQGFKYVRFPALDVRSFGEKIESLPIETENWHYVLNNIAYIVMPSALKGNNEPVFDGIIGRELFEDYTVAINIDTLTLILTDPDADIIKFYDYSLPIDLKTQTPFVEIKAKFPWEHKFSRKKLLVDMGYPGTIVVWGKQHYRDATTLKEYTYYRKRDIGFEMKATFRLGNDTFRKIPGYLNPKSPYSSKKREGIIGTAILNNYNYAFDYKRGKLYLKPTTAPFHRDSLIAYVPNDAVFIKKRFSKNPRKRDDALPRVVIR